MVLDILSEKLGSRNCIHVIGKFHIRKRVQLGVPLDEEDLAVDDQEETDRETTEQPAYDPRIQDKAHNDAQLLPGVREIIRNYNGDDTNRVFVNVI